MAKVDSHKNKGGHTALHNSDARLPGIHITPRGSHTEKINSKSSVVRRIANLAVGNKNHLHVLPRSGRWVIRREGADKVMGIYSTRVQAVDAAKKEIALRTVSSVYIHDATGMVAETISK